MIDFHTHVLPSVDDGSSSVEESIRMINSMEEQGVEKVVLTPHFYAYRTDVNTFFSNRRSAEKLLSCHLRENGINVSLYPAAEVLYFDEIWRIDDMEKLCIGGTNYVMVEMPFGKWTDAMIRNLEKLSARGFVPIIAHFDRYIKFQHGMKRFYELLEIGALLQMNADYLTNFWTRRKALSFFKRGLVSALGSDCHNMTSRPPEIKGAYDYLKAHLSEGQMNRFISQQRVIIKNAIEL